MTVMSKSEIAHRHYLKRKRNRPLREPTKGCVHWWKIDQSGLGRCKFCLGERKFVLGWRSDYKWA